jgi:hypothetical protein
MRRDIPLRLLHVRGPRDPHTCAKVVVNEARAAVEATGKQVKIEVEIAEGAAIPVC